ncbi:MAG: class I SAM-dependent methyltransferase [Pseudarcicella sp.]|nr:class I SAM-dependent methyltransferase [Pseudarcicella sp.]
MAFDFHQDRKKYFNFQYLNTKNSIIPFIEQTKQLEKGLRVLEVGCRDGGVLKPFLERGCHITGFDLEEAPVLSAKLVYKEEIEAGKASFFVKNVHDYIAENKDNPDQKFDIIVLKDVIEHVFGHQEMINGLKQILRKDGVMFFGFPPWQNPFGGHQQVLNSNFWSKVPYYHLLPDFIYYNIIKMVDPYHLPFVKDTKATRITPEVFEGIIQKENCKILQRNLYLINPIYEYKFNLKGKLQYKWLANIKYLRNYFTTNCDYLIAYDQ